MTQKGDLRLLINWNPDVEYLINDYAGDNINNEGGGKSLGSVFVSEAS